MNRARPRSTSIPRPPRTSAVSPLVGCEFALVFARFGAGVTVVEAQSRLLPGDEPEAGELLAETFAAEEISVRDGVSVTGVDHESGQFSLHLDGEVLTAGRLLVATGRRTDLAVLGVDARGVDEQARTITVDERMRAADGLWAIGDVTGKGAFTHVSLYQARIATADILGADSETADYRVVPRVTFTDPEVGPGDVGSAPAARSGARSRTAASTCPVLGRPSRASPRARSARSLPPATERTRAAACGSPQMLISCIGRPPRRNAAQYGQPGRQ